MAGIATAFAIVVTVYFWWENTKGIAESSEKALHIMKLVTVMVVLLIGWCIYTALLRHSSLPPFPYPRNLRLTPSALGWLAHTVLPQFRRRRDLHRAGPFRAGHERRGIPRAGLSRNREPEAAQP